MLNFKRICCLIFVIGIVFSMSSCDPVDSLYGTESNGSEIIEGTSIKSIKDISHPTIMSSDRIMSKYVDISLFDEENYAEVYLGKRFKFNVSVESNELSVPTTIKAIGKSGWKLVENSQYNFDSMVFAGESVDAVFENEQGKQIKALFYNSSNKSVKLSKCKIVKFRIENDFYTNPDNYIEFNVNGINNKLAITDIIDNLGTPSHFYSISGDNYYLDYFVSKDDRRNGITVHINPVDDSITAVEFSHYK